MVDISKLSVYNDAMASITVLKNVIKAFDSQADFARECRVTPQAITKWLKFGLPPKKALTVERVYFRRTGKRDITRHDLCPEMYPAESNDVAA